MPNEEPEGPNLPPEKKGILAKSASLELKNPDKYHKLKGCIAAIASIIVAGSLIFFWRYLRITGIKLNELYFFTSGVGISVLTGIMFTFLKPNLVFYRTVLLFTSVFYAIIELIYLVCWIILGKPYAYFKIALIIGLTFGIIYFLYDKLSHVRRNDS